MGSSCVLSSSSIPSSLTSVTSSWFSGLLPTARALFSMKSLSKSLSKILYVALYVATSPGNNFPFGESSEELTNEGPLLRDKDLPFPSIIVSIIEIPVIVIFPLFSIVIV